MCLSRRGPRKLKKKINGYKVLLTWGAYDTICTHCVATMSLLDVRFFQPAHNTRQACYKPPDNSLHTPQKLASSWALDILGIVVSTAASKRTACQSFQGGVVRLTKNSSPAAPGSVSALPKRLFLKRTPGAPNAVVFRIGPFVA